MIRAVFAVLFCVNLVFAPPARAERLEHLPGLAPADHTVIQSAHTGRPYHVFVRLPEGYGETDRAYPTVYLLDGDILFPILGAYHLLLHYDEPVPDAIIVGVGYGTFNRDGGNYRATDYSTPPLPEDYRKGVDDGAPNGGAARFQAFISHELIPMIEERYRANPERRILVGQSRGAHFVLFTALSDPGLFWGRIASNPSLLPNKEFFFQDLSAIALADSHLFFSSGSRDWERLRKQTLELFAHWENADYLPWRLEMATMDGETHAAGITNVYRRAMIWLFENEPQDE